ncbi:oxidative stress-induced growth inhibitor 1 [Caerostris extrusa]|uniref:Oxidative stress-induced growth inhibitor 1 n=1 Tax=Caerostris extrusa TaxID=172846 RepID=A0AAV4S950_CAEEX|nr:oxidative stress-induced growth inhibitor 1 [Caerostris extrusa]
MKLKTNFYVFSGGIAGLLSSFVDFRFSRYGFGFHLHLNMFCYILLNCMACYMQAYLNQLYDTLACYLGFLNKYQDVIWWPTAILKRKLHYSYCDLNSLIEDFCHFLLFNFISMENKIFKEAVIIGNGPSAITLSYMLSGNWPYYNGLPHPIDFLQYRLEENRDKSLLEQDLAYLSEGLEGRSLNPVSVLFDTLVHPQADLGVENESVISWKFKAENAIDHIVLGKGIPGGSWQKMDGSTLTISLASWMELPNLSIQEWDACRNSYITPHVVLATGNSDKPNKLNAEGQDLPFVMYSLAELECMMYKKMLLPNSDHLLIVGAGLSAADAHPDLSFLPNKDLDLCINPKKPIDCKKNPIDINLYSHESMFHSGLFAVGPLVGDNFVRFVQGGSLAVASHISNNIINKIT